MQFMAIVRRRIDAFTSEEFDAVLDAEAERVRALYTEGTLRSVHSRGDIPGAVLIFEGNDEASAHAAMASLPLAQRNMLEYQLIPLRPYRGFAPIG